MKKLLMTAAALTLGTSAWAWTPAEDAHLAAAAPSGWTAGKSPFADSSVNKGAVMKAESAALGADWAKGEDAGMKSLAKYSGGATVQTASGATGAKVSTDGGMTFADADIKSKEDVGGIQTASAETGAKVSTDGGMIFADADIKSKDDVGGIQTAEAAPAAGAEVAAATGMGGPIETPMGWRACEPGPGDDRCIQLYERGVRPALAAWKATDDNVGMGGPLEPADTGAKPATSASLSGRVMQRSGYPPCRPGRGDDGCIQLYERGVTGRRN